ncbi:MAG: hypothetical protein RL584_204 [Pseudomonadota bacterium]
MTSRIKKGLAALAGLLLLSLGGASCWFWFTPVGLNNYINKITLQALMRSPESLTSLGLVDDTVLDFHGHKLTPFTREQELASLAFMRQAREGLNRYGPEGLEGQERLTWEIAAWMMDDQIAQAQFERGGYRLTQLDGVTVQLPQFLTDVHPIRSPKGARRYLQRMVAFADILQQAHERVEQDRDHGVVPPDFIVRRVLEQLRAFVAAPAAEHVLVTSLQERLKAVDTVGAAQAAELSRRAQDILERRIVPGYRKLITLHEALLQQTDSRAGIDRLPQGREIYAAALASHTTTRLTAQEIHALGLKEVAGLKAEMVAILNAQGIGQAQQSLAQRIADLNRQPGQVFPNTDEGRAAMIAHLYAIHERVMQAAPRHFKTVPPHPLEIVRVPEYQQDGSPGGYYNSPALDGSRPGRFYINLKDTADNPRWTLASFMIHEGAPGHHFQAAAALSIRGVPLMRQMANFTAYAEGWALYAERIAKTDMGLYEGDPLGDLGRLQAEMFRAARLVVDTGLHAKGWSREQAIDYMIEHTGMPAAEIEREVERYVVSPGQATAYKVGQLAILDMRREAQAALGARFDAREFHEVVLMNGGMPLDLLRDTVQRWVRKLQ